MDGSPKLSFGTVSQVAARDSVLPLLRCYCSWMWISAQEHCNLIKLALGPVCQPVLLGWQSPPWLVILNYTFRACTTPSTSTQYRERLTHTHTHTNTQSHRQTVVRKAQTHSDENRDTCECTHKRTHTHTHRQKNTHIDKKNTHLGFCFGTGWCGCA